MIVTINKVFQSNFKKEIYYLIGENDDGIEYKIKGRFNTDLEVGDMIHLYKYASVDSFLECESYEKIRSKNVSFIFKLLVSEIKGVGEVLADNIVKKYGVDTIFVIENEADKLLQVPKIGMETMTKICECYKAIPEEKRKLMLIGLSALMAEKTMHKYNYDEITNNPYLLLTVDGIGWIKADFIARSLGYDELGEYRLFSAVNEVMRVNTEVHGHTYIEAENLIKDTCKLISIDPEQNKNLIAGVVQRMAVV